MLYAAVSEYGGIPVYMLFSVSGLLFKYGVNGLIGSLADYFDLARLFGKWLFCFEGELVAIAYNRHHNDFLVWAIGEDEEWWAELDWGLTPEKCKKQRG